MGLPIGSGVTEAACKTVFTQRFKAFGKVLEPRSGLCGILDLCGVYLSGIWDEAFKTDLHSRELPEPEQQQLGESPTMGVRPQGRFPFVSAV